MTAPGRLQRWRWGEPVDGLRRLLENGGVLAIPSESSYGLAADPRSAAGVAAIFELKGRQGDQALPVVAADLDQIIALGVDPGLPQLTTLDRIWPAALTAVLPIARPLAAAAGHATLALRIPAHRRLCGLLADLGFALTATSANRSGEPPILDPQHLESFLQPSIQRLPFDVSGIAIVDDGILPGGPPSTLVRWDPTPAGSPDQTPMPHILRQGAYPERLVRQLTEPPAPAEQSTAAGEHRAPDGAQS
ncbi:MAG: L-threonylcarbamoyladenylate synthase [Acidobacteriota bacterium]